jgi:hypothetical protein
VGVLCKCRAEVASEKSATKAANTQALSGTRVLNGMPKVDLVMVEPSCVPIARVGGSPLFLLSQPGLSGEPGFFFAMALLKKKGPGLSGTSGWGNRIGAMREVRPPTHVGSYVVISRRPS